ncbi:hypothetical protein A2875_04925 [Candidatus Gottesmanbacteria bacterium RIFCSPHIGHO2_01_FULL_46_14]|uniref:TrpR like protein, YerC/YecD n=3 Tax=Microgenomates group TaxID=1794810 RepID=A0A1F5ZQJ1_9BACT|nr:MAG: hypothetical protein UU34_C0006G0037 [Candidatus Curtissbacteria bacterium GW2011_GWA1_41_11]OGG14671.1 MAG: hypothetical protein A2875_04925 [Candidatus Gottesmanbacteria bacterium RIFCSPHIGHO2_01_FULL_46_14]OGG29928.1 MAG: hypothetical protein A2971_04215 [Candidatus Gottesmanbacteria bacterium RIFCSPLOWO2_01_FULL_46_21]
MAQVSNRRVSSIVEKRIFDLFFHTIAELNNESDVSAFLEDFLTPTERIVLAKRLSIALMLVKGFDYRTIQSTLKVSFPTVSSVSVWVKYRGRGYQKILERILRQEKFSDILDKVDETIGKVLLPVPPKGSDWSAWRRRQTQKKQERIRPY